MTISTETLQQRAARLVQQEVHCCLSSLVSTLAQGYSQHRQTAELFGQATDLAAPVLDYEEAALEAGWEKDDAGRWHRDEQDGEYAPDCATAEEACEHDGLDPHEREVFEHWAISAWLADKLEAAGEKVDRDFAGLIVWARTSTGQSISIDSVIERIAAELMAPESPEDIAKAFGFEIHHDAAGWYVVGPDEARDDGGFNADGVSLGWDGRPHYAAESVAWAAATALADRKRGR